MLVFSHRARFWTAIVVAVIMLTGTLSLAYASTGTVRFHIVKAGFIVGIGGGSGTLHFNGRNYRLGIGGINVGTIGASAVDLVGTATNLRTAADIVGTYTQGLQLWVVEEWQRCGTPTALSYGYADPQSGSRLPLA